MINAKNPYYHTLIKVWRILALFPTTFGYLILFVFETFLVFIRLVIDFIYGAIKDFFFGPYRKIISIYRECVNTLRSFSREFFKVFKKISKINIPKFKVPQIALPKMEFKFPKLSINLRVRGFAFFLFGIIFAIVFLFFPFKIYVWYRNLPRPELLVELGSNRSTRILDRNGRLLYEIYVDRKYNPVVLEDIPEHVLSATLAIEDDRFFSHLGFRMDSIMRAAKASMFEDDLQGASTVTQQLVKNVFLTPERTISRKVKELVLSVLVEQKYSKNEILELYLNNIPYGGTAWGIEAASQKFFGKSVSELSLGEATLLAGLPSAPSAYTPLDGDSTLAKKRQRQVLNRMVTLGYITSDEADEAFSEKLTYVPQKEFIQAPHFVSYVRELLEKEYGRRYLEFGGLTVTTSLDLDLHEKVQSIVSEGVSANSYLNISNGASVVLDSKTGEILAYVGSVDYFKDSWGAYDVVTAFRQPGSSIKPLTYALAFEKGFTPASTVEDKPVTYKSMHETYTPVNYDNKYHGTVTLREALANSYNIPAVKLVDAVGPDNVASLGKKLGLLGWNVDGAYGLSITLGGREVRLLDLANVYATFSRGGIYKETQPILSVKDSSGYEVYRRDSSEQQIVSSEVAYLITNILSDNVARLPAFGSNSSLVVSNHTVAVKTGTTDNKRDNWTFGYTPSFTVGVWVGNNDNAPMNQYLASGLSGAAPIWNRIMREVLKGVVPEQFAKPENILVKFDEDCGKAEVFVKGTRIPEELCVVEGKEDKDDTD